MSPASVQESRIQRVASFLAGAILLSGGLLIIWLWEIQGVRHLAANLLGSYLFVWLVAAMISRRQGELHVRFLLATASSGLVIIALEAIAVLGLVDYRMLFGVRQPEAWLQPESLFDDELLHRQRPHAEYSGTHKGNIAIGLCLPDAMTEAYRYELRYDQNGFRNDRDLESARIAVLGDSYIEAVAVASEAALTGRLAEFGGGAVANLGLRGYGPLSELAVLKRFALPLEPEVVVWAFYEGNDLRDMAYHDETMQEFRSGLLKTEPSRRDLSFTKNAAHALYGMLHDCQMPPRAQRLFGIYRTADGQTLQMYFVSQEEPPEADQQPALDRLSEILREAYELADSNGARFVLLYVPNKFRVYEEFVELPAQSDLHSWRPSDLPARLEETVRSISTEIGFVDLTVPFVREAANGRLLYFHDDTHWTEEGHLVAAEALWAFLSGWESVPPR